jgi:subfamily B ATP-binding cassette protein MsbA
MRRINLKIQETMGHVTHVAEEVIESFKVVRLFGGQNYESEKFNHVTAETARQEMKAVVTKSINVSTVQFLGVLALSGMIIIGTSASGVQQLSAGSFAAMIAAMLALLKPLKELTTVSSIIQRGLAGVESIFGLLDEPVEKDTGTISLQRAKGAISLQQVNFSYERNDQNALDAIPVLRNINIDISPGMTVALVGRSGSGKTTLVNLLPRFYECASGQIILDGVPVQQYRLADLRNQFSLVSQNITLFNDTVAHNIAYGQLANEVTEAEIIAAAKAAHAMEFIETLPDGINSLIGENGVLLSGGQRQRLAIARAILKNAPILILDEATSALDTESERMIQAAIDKLIENRTTIIVAHRLSTIEKADQIIVLDKGEIKEMGTHQQLFQLNGYYAKFHNMQFNFNQEETGMCAQIIQ